MNIEVGGKYPVLRPGHSDPICGVAIKEIPSMPGYWKFRIGKIKCSSTLPHYSYRWYCSYCHSQGGFSKVSCNNRSADIKSTWDDYLLNKVNEVQTIEVIRDIFEENGMPRNRVRVKNGILLITSGVDPNKFLGMLSKK
jgi:hypothetical protein